MKRLLAILMSALMVCALAMPVSAESDLQTLVNDACAAGKDLTLSQSYNENITIPENCKITIDLNGNSVTGDSSTETIAVRESGVSLTIKNGTISNPESVFYTYKGADDVNVTFDNMKILVTDGSHNYQAIGVQGTNQNQNIKLINSTVDAAKASGIYFPPKTGNLVIENSSVKGTVGVYVKGGDVVFNNSTITATGDLVDSDVPYDGDPNDTSLTRGVALYLEGGYKDRESTVTVNGGSFEATGDGALAVAQRHIDTNKSIEVNSGTFSDTEVLKYVTNTAEIEIKLGRNDALNEDLTIPKDSKVTLDLNGHTLGAVEDGFALINDGSLTVRNSVPGQGGLEAGIENKEGASVNIVDKAITTDKIYGEGDVLHTTTPVNPSRPSTRPSSPSKDLPSNTKECQKEFGDEYIWSDEYDACVIKFMIVDTSTK